MWKKALKAGCVVAAMTIGATQAHALKIKELTLTEQTGTHDIHVAYSLDADNWTTATPKPVVFKLDWRLNVRSLKPIKSERSKLFLSVLGSNGIGGTYTLHEKRDNPGVFEPTIAWREVRTLNFPGNKLILAPSAVSACQQLHAAGKRPTKSHRILIGQITSRVDANVGNYSAGFIKSASKTVTSDVYAVCDKDPDWKPPARAGARFHIASFAVHPHGGSNSCPSPHDLKVVFRAKAPKTIKFRVRINGQLSELYTRTLVKDGSYFQARFDKAYKLDPGQTTFRIEVRDELKSEVIEKSVTCPPFKIISTFMKYTHGNETYCPKVVRETTTFKTTRPGWVRYQIKLQGGLVAAEGKATSKRVGDAYIAEVNRDLPFNTAFDGELMAEVTNQPGANSSWTKLKVDCLKMSNPEITLVDSENAGGKHQCPRKGRVKVSMRFNQAGKRVTYKVNCSNGFSKTVETATRRDRVNGGYRVFGFHQFEVNKTEQVACSLMDMDHGSKVVAWTGRGYQCVNRAVDSNPGAGLAPAPQPTTSQAEPERSCETNWKTECKRVPTRECHSVVEKQCKLVPKSTCSNVVTKTCTPKRTRVCKKVRGNNVCKVVVTRDCKRNVKRVCKRKMVRTCEQVSKNKCSVTYKKSCKRKKVVSCSR